nr:MAG TPA: hypothetical protein [Inoviridae sp.]DAV13374.1 MAG TPA: hypothetical protein [Caudoviricetes sp.]
MSPDDVMKKDYMTRKLLFAFSAIEVKQRNSK